MQVQELMTPDAQCVTPTTTLRDAAQQMKKLDVGSLPVCDNDQLVGILTDRDMVIRAVANGADSAKASVRDAMTSDITYCFEDQDLEEATKIMKDKQIRRLPVLDRNKRLVGMLSLGDLATNPNAKSIAEETLESVSQS